jgi:hypothetical protein
MLKLPLLIYPRGQHLAVAMMADNLFVYCYHQIRIIMLPVFGVILIIAILILAGWLAFGKKKNKLGERPPE